MSELQLTLLSIVGSSLGGAFGAWLALRDRVMKIEHELWGVKGTNGLKKAVQDMSDNVLLLLQHEKIKAVRRPLRQQSTEEDE